MTRIIQIGPTDPNSNSASGGTTITMSGSGDSDLTISGLDGGVDVGDLSELNEPGAADNLPPSIRYALSAMGLLDNEDEDDLEGPLTEADVDVRSEVEIDGSSTLHINISVESTEGENQSTSVTLKNLTNPVSDSTCEQVTDTLSQMLAERTCLYGVSMQENAVTVNTAVNQHSSEFYHDLISLLADTPWNPVNEPLIRGAWSCLNLNVYYNSIGDFRQDVADMMTKETGVTYASADDMLCIRMLSEGQDDLSGLKLAYNRSEESRLTLADDAVFLLLPTPEKVDRHLNNMVTGGYAEQVDTERGIDLSEPVPFTCLQVYRDAVDNWGAGYETTLDLARITLRRIRIMQQVLTQDTFYDTIRQVLGSASCNIEEYVASPVTEDLLVGFRMALNCITTMVNGETPSEIDKSIFLTTNHDQDEGRLGVPHRTLRNSVFTLESTVDRMLFDVWDYDEDDDSEERPGYFTGPARETLAATLCAAKKLDPTGMASRTILSQHLSMFSDPDTLTEALEGTAVEDPSVFLSRVLTEAYSMHLLRLLKDSIPDSDTKKVIANTISVLEETAEMDNRSSQRDEFI